MTQVSNNEETGVLPEVEAVIDKWLDARDQRHALTREAKSKENVSPSVKYSNLVSHENDWNVVVDEDGNPF